MAKQDCNPSTPAQGSKKLQTQDQARALILARDELDEVLALNAFLFEAMEAINKERLDTEYHSDNHFGLTLFIQYLRQRALAVKEQLKAVH